VRLPAVCHPILDEIGVRLPELRSAQQEGLALWVYGVIEAQTGCESRVVTPLEDVAYQLTPQVKQARVGRAIVHNERARRVCAAFHVPRYDHLTITKNAA
jgi:hypothetical protein